MTEDAIRLLRDREHVRQSIAGQIRLGDELLADAAAIRDEASLDEHGDRYRTWNEYNRTLLEVCFSGPIASEYDPPGIGVYFPDETLGSRIETRRSDLRERLRELDSLVQRLDLLEDRGASHRPHGAGQGDVDPGLWEHVRSSVENEEWPQAAASAATFVESRVREWAGLGPDSYGKSLMTAAFHPGGSPLTLGKTSAEREGWHLLGMGFVAAVGNVDRHRIQDRPDARRYALGVIYTASLILTQIRRQYSDRTGPA